MTESPFEPLQPLSPGSGPDQNSQPDSQNTEPDPDDLKLGSERTRDPMEVVASQFLEELREGHRPSVDNYVVQYPALEQEIRELLPMMLALEDVKVRQELDSVRQSLPEQLDIQQLGEFKILREIGRGGMGIVFEGVQEKIGRHVAIKLLPWRFPSRSRWRKQFEREAQLAARLKHPNIVTVYAYGEENGHCYYAMQLIEGVGLDRLIQRLRQGRGIVAVDEIHDEFRQHGVASTAGDSNFSNRVMRRGAWHQFAKIAAQVANAVRYAHQQGTLHRDIKPANIMLDTKGALRITDFGLATAKEHALSSHEALAGTLRYMAPEQFDGRFDERSDIYAFGVTLYELCTLTPAFDSSSRDELIRNIRSGNRRPPRQVEPSLPRPLASIISKCTALRPQDRYQKIGEVLEDLTRFLTGRRLQGQRAGIWRWLWPFGG